MKKTSKIFVQSKVAWIHTIKLRNLKRCTCSQTSSPMAPEEVSFPVLPRHKMRKFEPNFWSENSKPKVCSSKIMVSKF